MQTINVMINNLLNYLNALLPKWDYKLKIQQKITHRNLLYSLKIEPLNNFS